MIIVKVSICYY